MQFIRNHNQVKLWIFAGHMLVGNWNFSFLIWWNEDNAFVNKDLFKIEMVNLSRNFIVMRWVKREWFRKRVQKCVLVNDIKSKYVSKNEGIFERFENGDRSMLWPCRKWNLLWMDKFLSEWGFIRKTSQYDHNMLEITKMKHEKAIMIWIY